MKASNKLASWGDAELDRLWSAMHRQEMDMDDFDLATDSPKLKAWEALNVQFRARLDAVGGAR